ncbi:hypothetical protein OG226_13820 [Streptomyces sp. NBC_01261]|uniref:hypothetical protein n=1 Tax=unclassified Streptomyces TaxID=2593676 RepID=UPI002E2D87FB|nr:MULTISPECIES: hypothetical protein [unclassified Streptomyces]
MDPARSGRTPGRRQPAGVVRVPRAAAIGLSAGIVSEELFTALVLVALVTTVMTVMTVPVLSGLDRRDGRSRTAEEAPEGEEEMSAAPS